MGSSPKLVIEQQVIVDQVTGLTLRFMCTESGESRIVLEGDCMASINDLKTLDH